MYTERESTFYIFMKFFFSATSSGRRQRTCEKKLLNSGNDCVVVGVAAQPVCFAVGLVWFVFVDDGGGDGGGG